MVKERKSAYELSQLICQAARITDLEVTVRSDHAFGWLPTVLSGSSDLIGCQRRVEEIAHRLRVHYDLAS